MGLIRRILHNFYVTEKMFPCVSNLRRKSASEIGFKDSNTSVRELLKKLGFRWTRTKSNRYLLIEKSDIREKQISYLRDMGKYRKEGREIVYIDESYILSSHVQKESWSDNSLKGVLNPISKGDRLIMIHAGGERGFVPNALVMWKANQSTGDYHKDINQKNYEKWVREKLVSNLRPNSVVVLDNAPYHNVALNRAPNSNARRDVMRN